MYGTLTAEQIRQRKFLKKGLRLTIMVIGESGTGKATFINTLCDSDVIPPNKKGINKYIASIYEGGTKINLDIVMANGFGDSIDNSKSTSSLLAYLEDQFESFLKEECRIQRSSQFDDTRVHAALYFVRPTGKGLRPLDVECMKALSERCNVIPIISKGDLLTDDERALNRKLIMRDIKEAGIVTYDFTGCFDDMGEAFPGLDTSQMVPFSLICGTETRIIEDTEYKVRVLPHGIVKVDDPKESDFPLLRTCLLGACLQDLKDITHDVFYEHYRTEKLSEAKKGSLVRSGTKQ